MSDARRARAERSTRETTISLALDLGGGERRIETPDGFFTHMLEALATHAGWGLEVAASGDTRVDLHHTVEDTGVVLGEALARAVVDLSGRGFFAWRCPPEVEALWVTPAFPLTLVADFFQAFADRGRLTLHLELLGGRNGHHLAEAAFKAVALALRQAVAMRPGVDETPSTKGTLTA